MTTSSTIPITYINATGDTDFQVVVFTENYNPNTPKSYYAAWEILRGQSRISFHYPVDLAVGAKYETGDQSISCGPFKAELGSSWEITQRDSGSTPVLKAIYGSPNPDGSIVIKNIAPKNAEGRPYDMGIYKSGKLLVVQKGVKVGDQTDFMLKPKLFFGVVRNMHVGQVFTSLETTIHHTEFDLEKYAYGLKVTLTLGEGPGGQYKFTGTGL